MISREAGVSYYQQLSSILIRQIEGGTFQSGDRLPTEMEMSKRYRLNRHTVRKALEKLEYEGFIYKIKGKGTFIANNKIPYKISRKTSFTTSVPDVGLNPDARLIDYYEVAAESKLAKKLNLPPSSKVIVLEILRFVNGVPYCHTTSYLASSKFPGLRDFIKGSFSLYSLLKRHYSVDAVRAFSTFEVSMPEIRDIDLLQISAKAPLLVVKSASKSQEGEIVECCITRFRGDLCSITVDFNGEGR